MINLILRSDKMEKFSMPEQVSATLEIDETTRLKKSLEATISKEEADRIVSELSWPVNSTPGARDRKSVV